MQNRQAIILAAGRGTRMKSDKPKVLHTICGQTMLDYVIENAKNAHIDDIAVIIGYKAEEVGAALPEYVQSFVQKEQLGTGHAVKQALPFIEDHAHIVILCGDAPLVTANVIEDLCRYTAENHFDAVVLSTKIDDPTGYGRIVRDANGEIHHIVEHKDATEKERQIEEINSGVYCFQGDSLRYALSKLHNNNAQNEYYFTDTLQILLENHKKVGALIEKDARIIKAVNDKAQLAEVEALMREKINTKWLYEGVTMLDPKATYISYNATLSPGVTLYPGVVIEGNSRIGENTVVTSSSRIVDSIIGRHCTIQSSTIFNSTVGDSVSIGPYAHLRPQTEVGDQVRIGNFVETKKSKIGNGSKVSHLTYVGDGHVGENVNIGCGVVFVNYDGTKKHITTIENNAFVGCNVNLVAPVTVGEGAYVAAGSTITDDVEPYSLAIARQRQTNKLDRMRKKEEE